MAAMGTHALDCRVDLDRWWRSAEPNRQADAAPSPTSQRLTATALPLALLRPLAARLFTIFNLIWVLRYKVQAKSQKIVVLEPIETHRT